MKNPNSAIKIVAKSRLVKLKNIVSPLDKSINVIELNHEIVLDIRFNGIQLSDILRYIAEKSLNGDFIIADHDKGGSVKELAAKKNDPIHEIIEDKEESLTCREAEVMEKLSTGLVNKEIASCMGLSLYTVKNHLKNIFRKRKVGSRLEAIVGYIKNKNKNKNISSDH
jgi:DNA-binding CsgD family transcriptional regulator